MLYGKQLPTPPQASAAGEAANAPAVPATASEYMRGRAAREQRQAFHAERALPRVW